MSFARRKNEVNLSSILHLGTELLQAAADVCGDRIGRFSGDFADFDGGEALDVAQRHGGLVGFFDGPEQFQNILFLDDIMVECAVILAGVESRFLQFIQRGRLFLAIVVDAQIRRHPVQEGADVLQVVATCNMLPRFHERFLRDFLGDFALVNVKTAMPEDRVVVLLEGFREVVCGVGGGFDLYREKRENGLSVA